ncbi:MAG: Cys-tRNA(Pro) deacylase [Paenisporosarcina sp.]
MAKANKISKTNAVRLLDQHSIAYTLHEYTVVDGQIDGVSVANKIGQPVEMVFKTLVASSAPGRLYIYLIPVDKELDLKASAKAAGEKKVDLIPVKDLLGLTGYVRGGCSPLGMKKLFPTFVDISAKNLEFIIVSAGKIGMQIQLNPADLISCTKGEFVLISRSL